MGNLAGVVAVLAVIFRPSLVVPHVQVSDIRHLDWEALYANGVRFLVFDKDNCLTAPHSDHLEPAIAHAWKRCQEVFGRENILIVSNSSGSSDDPSGLGAESLSRALNVPVLCHKQKKPARGCAAEALEYFVALSYDRDTTIAQASLMPPGTGCIEAGPSRETNKYLRQRRKFVGRHVPADEDGHGSILLVGDRTMTDVVLAHRMQDELSRRSKKLGLNQSSTSASTTAPPPQCISVFTTGIWTYEGRLNALMRKLETRVTSFLSSKGVRPGQPGVLSFRGAAAIAPVDWQKIASAPAVDSQPIVLPVADAEAARFAYTGDRVPAASPTEPTLGAILVAAMVRPLPPRIASILSSVLTSRPLVWLSSNLRDGWNVMMKGLEYGIREAGIQPQLRSRAIPSLSGSSSATRPDSGDAHTLYDMDEVAPKSRSDAKKNAVSASLVDYLESRIPKLPTSFPRLDGPGEQLRNRLSLSSPDAAFLSRLSPLQKPASTPRPTSRSLHTSRVRLSSAPNPGHSGRPRVPKRNWIAAFSALVIVPASYYAGMRLHDLKDTKAIDPTAPLPPTPAKPAAEIHQHHHHVHPMPSAALLRAQQDRRRQLELTLFHLVREREHVLEKLERVHQRRLESPSSPSSTSSSSSSSSSLS